MEHPFQIIQQVYYMLNIFNSYSQNEREELVKGYNRFLFTIHDILEKLGRIVEGSTYWGWKIDWGYQPWQLRTYCEQKGLTLQAGWEDRVDFGLDVYRNIPISYRTIPIPVELPRVLTPIDLDAWEAREAESGVSMDICRVCHIQHERPVAFHEFIPDESSCSSSGQNANDTQELPVFEEDSDLDSLPELEDEINLDTLEIPSWLVLSGVTVTFHGGWVIYEREQGPPWQEVLAQMLEQQHSTLGSN